MLWFICFFNYADRQAIFSVFPKLKEEFGFDKVQLGLIGSAFMWVYAAGAPLAGVICDRFRRKDLILGGCLFWSFVTMMYIRRTSSRTLSTASHYVNNYSGMRIHSDRQAVVSRS